MVIELAEKRAGGPFTLLVHSLGTILALKIAARIPDGVRKIISVGGLPAPLPLTRMRLTDRAATIRKNGMHGIGDFVVPLMLSERTIRTMPNLIIMLRRLVETSDATGYAEMTDACNACHVYMERPYVVIKVPGAATASAYPNQEFLATP